MKSPYTVGDCMTSLPHTIGEDIPLSKAIEMLREYQIHHLPVQREGKVTGVLSDRDIKLALSIHPSAKDLKVGDIMTEQPYAVFPETPLSKVAMEMAIHKLGCAVVKNDVGRAIGIFTVNDALRVLAEAIDSLKKPLKNVS